MSLDIRDAEVGMRVRRGPDWDWQDQDKEGEGVIVSVGDRIGGQDQIWVQVDWDFGGHNSYRCGPDFFDLEAVDGSFFDMDKFNEL